MYYEPRNTIAMLRNILLLIAMIFSSIFSHADTPDKYKKLWEKYEEKVSADHPREAIIQLDQIIKVATADKSYGNLLAARVLTAKILVDIEPDSLKSEVSKLEKEAAKAEHVDANLAAVYYATLGRIYRECGQAWDESYEKLSSDAFDKALRNPDSLHMVNADDYAPFTKKTSEYFRESSSSLLALIANEANRNGFLLQYYEQKGLRKAACQLMYNYLGDLDDESLELESKGITLADTLRSAINKYADLEEAGFLADVLFEEMNDDDDISKEECYMFLQKAIERWGNGIAGPELRNSLNDLTKPEINISLERREDASIYADSPLPLIISGTNIGDTRITITRLNANGRKKLNKYSTKGEKEIRSLKTGDPVFTIERSYKEYESWQEINDTINVNPLPAGVYTIESSSKTNPKLTTIDVIYLTGIKLLAYPLNEKDVRFITVSESTGKPIAGANIRIESKWYNKKEATVTNLITDNEGKATFKKVDDRANNVVFVSTDSDKAFWESNLYCYFSTNKNVTSQDIATIYTDRSIYRPGQTAHVTVVVHNAKDNNNIHAVEGKRMKIMAFDANHEQFFVDSLTTDAFGVASAVVTLPKDRLNGRFFFTAKGKDLISSTAYFNVEDYKRPTFEINKPELEKEYLAIDSLNEDINGGYRIVNVEMGARTFTNMPLQGAKVKYSITRNEKWCWWRGYDMHGRQMVQNAETSTDAEGKFTIPVTLKVPRNSHRRYTFNVDATVTSANGESHSETVTLNVRSDNNIPEEPKPLKPEEREEFFELSTERFPAIKDGKHSEVTFRMGSCLKDIRAYYIIHSENGIVEEGTTDFSNEIISRTFRYDAAYGEALHISYMWVRNGITHSFDRTIGAPLPEKKMETKWVTFRDHTRPGATEKWTLHTDAKATSLAATLYDKSLDMINPMSWTFDPFRNNFWFGFSMYNTSVSGISSRAWNNIKTEKSILSSLHLPSFEDKYFPSYRIMFKGVKVRGATTVYRSMPMAANSMVVTMEPDESALDEIQVVGYGVQKKAIIENDAKLMGTAAGISVEKVAAESMDLSKMVRSDFSETAFTTPSILSDKDGNITIEFTMPESITTWRMLGIVHDKEMRYDIIDTTCVAQKAVMVQPNMPRFVREGDNATISVSVTNNEAKGTNANVVMQVVDPETEFVLYADAVCAKLEANSAQTVTFSLPTLDKRIADAGKNLLMVRIAAKTDNGEDGEQHYLPILPSREMIISTVPFTIHGNGSFKTSVKDLFTPSSTHRRLTLETTENPAWLMVQTLPYIAKVNSNNAISLSAAIYANTLASDIIATVPEFDKVLAEWKADSIALKSNLDKNSDLKDLLLQQTPWVLDAKNEAEQKQLLAEYFDSEKLNDQLAECTSQLKALQLSDGSWTWFPGMSGSPYITTSVTQMLARLSLLSELNDEQKEMMHKGMKFLGNELQKDARELRKLEKKKIKGLRPSEFSMVYIYITSIVKTDMPKGVKQDVEYIIKLMEKLPAEFTIYGKARAAVIFARNGKAARAKEYIESMKEYSVSTPEAGRYYSTPRALYSWFDYRIPTQVAAIEALSILTPSDTVTIDEMKRWLLHEKRTQMWDTPLNTVDAVYAFLMDSSAYTTGTHRSAASAILEDKMEYTKEQIDVKTPVLDIEHATKNTLWGAIYVQQMAPLNEITDAASGISLKREVINSNTEGKVGDMVTVRITITCDRDYDFFVVTDNRPACLEPAEQISGYRYGYYQEMRDCQSRFFFDRISKGEHFVEAVYYIDRTGDYTSGTCTAQCAYAPEFTGRASAKIYNIK